MNHFTITRSLYVHRAARSTASGRSSAIPRRLARPGRGGARGTAWSGRRHRTGPGREGRRRRFTRRSPTPARTPSSGTACSRALRCATRRSDGRREARPPPRSGAGASLIPPVRESADAVSRYSRMARRNATRRIFVSEPPESPDVSAATPTGVPPPPRAAGAAGDSSAPASREPDRPPGRIKRATAWGKRSARKAGEVADRQRGRQRRSSASVDLGFRTAERQRRVAAMVLAGGIAYRIFFWMLALSVVVSGVLGFFDPNAVQKTLEQHGVAGWAAKAVASSPVRRTGTSGGCSSSGVGLCSGRATRAARRSARPRDHLGSRPAEAGQAGSRLAALQRLHARLHRRAGGRAVCPRAGGDRRVRRDDARARSRVRFLAARVSRLPNAATGWLELVPGAVVVAVGLQAMHVFTVYFLGPKSRAPHSSTASSAS